MFSANTHFFACIAHAARLVSCAVILLCAPARAEDGPAFRGRQGGKSEAWSLFARLPSSRDTSYLAATFALGKRMMVSGSVVRCLLWSSTTRTMQFQQKVFVAGMGAVEHQVDRLAERYGDNHLTGTKGGREAVMTIGLDGLETSITMIPKAATVPLRDVFAGDWDNRRFNWSLIPQVRLTHGPTLSGNGHFQHWWGDEAQRYGDWIVVHTDNGTSLFVSWFPPENRNKDWLSGSFLLVVSPDGSRQLTRSFSYTVERHWQHNPVAMRIRAEQPQLDIRVNAFEDNQLVKTHGKMQWSGFGSSSGTVGDQPARGWAFMAPMEREPNR
jgi:hypothetical protein